MLNFIIGAVVGGIRNIIQCGSGFRKQESRMCRV